MEHKSDLQRYLRELNTALPFSPEDSAPLMEYMERAILDYVLEHPASDYAALCTQFGAPDQVAENFLGELSPAELLAAFRRQKRALNWLSLISGLVSLTWLGFCLANLL